MFGIIISSCKNIREDFIGYKTTLILSVTLVAFYLVSNLNFTGPIKFILTTYIEHIFIWLISSVIFFIFHKFFQ